MTEKAFVSRLEKIFAEEGFLTKRELGVGYGVADLVLVKIDQNMARKRILNGQAKPLLREQYFQTFKFLPDIHENKEPVTLSLLLKQTRLSSNFFKHAVIKNLIKSGYIAEVGDKRYVKINGWLPLAKDVIAIEAKMHDWKRGFYQANRYKAFANRVYLAVPSTTIHLVNKKLLEAHNVGLISLDVKNNKKKFILKPHKEQPFNENKRDYALEFFWPAAKKRYLQNA